jgi:transcriptional regulator with XRE-family HTH domain
MSLNTLRTEVEQRRIEKRIRLSAISAHIGKTQAQISRWLNGKGNLPDESVLKMVGLLDGEITENIEVTWKN